MDRLLNIICVIAPLLSIAMLINEKRIKMKEEQFQKRCKPHYDRGYNDGYKEMNIAKLEMSRKIRIAKNGYRYGNPDEKVYRHPMKLAIVQEMRNAKLTTEEIAYANGYWNGYYDHITENKQKECTTKVKNVMNLV